MELLLLTVVLTGALLGVALVRLIRSYRAINGGDHDA